MRFYRTANYFRVKSRAAFQEYLQRNGCELLLCEPGRVGFQGSEGAPLPQGEIAIVMEVTADLAASMDEGWINGRAIAIDSQGATRTLDLQEIFTRLDGQVTERMTG